MAECPARYQMFHTIKICLERTPDLVQTVSMSNQACQRVLNIDPYHTSQTCSACGHVSRNNRKGRHLTCVRYSFSLDADLNASRNIATFSRRVGGRLHASEPNVAGHEVEGREAIEAESSCKPTTLVVGS